VKRVINVGVYARTFLSRWLIGSFSRWTQLYAVRQLSTHVIWKFQLIFYENETLVIALELNGKKEDQNHHHRFWGCKYNIQNCNHLLSLWNICVKDLLYQGMFKEYIIIIM
jgi:hypothetical protein